MDRVLISSQAYQSADLRFVNQLILSLAHPPDGIQLGYNFTQTSVIDVGLAIAATNFLKGDWDYLLSIDYDILFNPSNNPNYQYGAEIKRIVESCKETGGLVAGPYLKRGREDQLCVVPLHEGNIYLGPGGGLAEVKYVPTGFTCISREILRTLADSMELVQYEPGTDIYPFFLPMIYENTYLTLDYAFSQRVRDAGFKIYLDTRIMLGHLGSKLYYVPVGDEGPRPEP